MYSIKRFSYSSLVCLLVSVNGYADNGSIPIGSGVVSSGMGGAGIANAADAISGIDNPALLGRIGNSVAAGSNSSTGIRELDTSDVDFGDLPFQGGRVKSSQKIVTSPQTALTFKVNDAFHVGLMAYRAANINAYFLTGPVAEIRPEPQTVVLETTVIAPTLSYAVSDNVSLGASLLFGYQEVLTRNLLSTQALGSGKGTSRGTGIKLGVDWRVNDQISLGATVQPAMSMSNIEYMEDFLERFGSDDEATIPTPMQIGLGLKVQLSDNTFVVADANLNQWSEEDFYDFFGWEDQTVYKLGIQHMLNDNTVLRLGYNYGKSPVEGGNRTNNDGAAVDQSGAEVPVEDTIDPELVGDGKLDAAFGNYPFVSATNEEHFTVGLGYKLSKSLNLDTFFLYSPKATQTSSGFSLTPGGLLPPGSVVKTSQKTFGIGISASF